MGVTEVDAQSFQSLPVKGTRIGALSGVCSGNPYGGKQYTYFRQSTGGGLIDVVGDGNCQNGGWCTYVILSPRVSISSSCAAQPLS